MKINPKEPYLEGEWFLCFDAQESRWRIMRVHVDQTGSKWLKTDSNLFFKITERFTKWTELP